MAMSDFRLLAGASLAALTIASAPAQSADDVYYPITGARVDLSTKLGKLTPDYIEGSSQASAFIIEFAQKHLAPLDRPQMAAFPQKYSEDTLVTIGVVPPQNLIGKTASPVCSFKGKAVLSKGFIMNGKYSEDNSPFSTEGRTPCSAWLLQQGKAMTAPTSVGESAPKNQ